MTDWMAELKGRERKEVEFAILYKREFDHGTAGHNSLSVIARLAELLDGAYELIEAMDNDFD